MYNFAKVMSTLLAGSLLASNAAYANQSFIPLSNEAYNAIVSQQLYNANASLISTDKWLDIDDLIAQGQDISAEKAENAANYTVWPHSESDYAWLMEVKTLFMQYRGCSVYNDALTLINTMYMQRMQFTYQHVDDLLGYLDTLKTEMPTLVDNNNIIVGERTDNAVIDALLSTGRSFVTNDSGYNTSAYNKWLNDVAAFNTKYIDSSVYLSLNNVLSSLKTSSTVNRNAQSTNQILGALDELAVQIDLTTTYVNRAVEKPVIEETALYYSGTPQTIISNGARYTVTGGTAQNVGRYTATLTLEADSVWTDWTNDPYTIDWSIERCPITNKGDFVMENIPSDVTVLDQMLDTIIVRDMRTNTVLRYGVDYTLGLSVADNADYPSVLTVYGKGNYTTPSAEADRLSIDVSFDEPVISFRWMTSDIDPAAEFGWELPEPSDSRTFNGYMTDIPTYSTYTSGDKVYVFYGWAPVDGGNDFVTRNTRFTEDTVLYGIFEEVVPGREIQIFHSNGGTEIGERYFYDGVTDMEMPSEPTRDGYDFAGWYEDADCTIPYTDTNSYCANVYAKWNAKECTITVDAGDFGTASVTSHYGEYLDAHVIDESILRICEVVNEGIFADPNYSIPIDLSKPVTGDMTVYLKLTRVMYAMTFVYNNGEPSMTDTTGAPIAVDANDIIPVYDGHVFDGWYSDDTLTTRLETIYYGREADHPTVYAGWKTVIPVPVPETFSYTGNTITSIVSDGTFTVEGNTGINAGEYTATITPVEGYCWADGTTDAKEVTWNITPASSEQVTVTFELSDVTSDVIEPGITVLGVDSAALVNGEDFEVVYTFNPDSDHGTAVITLAGNYAGELSLDFMEPNYTFTESQDTWQRGHAEPMVLKVDGNFSRFTGITVDGTALSADQYTATTGSTVISIKPEYLDSLDNGNHTVVVRFVDGTASMQFEVNPAPAIPTPTEAPATPTPTATPTDPATPTPTTAPATPTATPSAATPTPTPAPAGAVAADNIRLLDYQNYIPDNVEGLMRESVAFYINRGDVNYVALNNGRAYFTADEIKNAAFESWTELDSLGRTGPALACIDRSLMPASGAQLGDISSITPSGFKTNTPLVRTQLIAFPLTAETTNARNIITGSTELQGNMNTAFVQPVLNILNNYTNVHVMYRVTPVYIENDLVARGVIVEAYSVEDNGALINSATYFPNVSNTYDMNYNSGDAAPKSSNNGNQNGSNNGSSNSSTNTSWRDEQRTYYVNESSKKFHKAGCAYVPAAMSGNWRQVTDSYNHLIALGYTPCEHENWTDAANGNNGSSNSNNNNSGRNTNGYQTGITRYAEYYAVIAALLLVVAGTTTTIMIVKKRKEDT